MMADAEGKPYVALKSLVEAKALPDGIVILEGDYGGQVYVVAQAKCVLCSETELNTLLQDIDALEWDDTDGARVYFERGNVGAGVAGGMTGGRIVEGIWIHPELKRIETEITEVIAGKRQRLTVA